MKEDESRSEERSKVCNIKNFYALLVDNDNLYFDQKKIKQLPIILNFAGGGITKKMENSEGNKAIVSM